MSGGARGACLLPRRALRLQLGAASPSHGPRARWSVSVCSGRFSPNTSDIYVWQSGGRRFEVEAPAEAPASTAPPGGLQTALFSLGPPMVPLGSPPPTVQREDPAPESLLIRPLIPP